MNKAKKKEGGDRESTFFGVYQCPCGHAECCSIIFTITNPGLRPVPEDPDVTQCYATFPVQHAQELVDKIRKFAAELGVTVT